jgi:hypothetical protein
LALLTAGYTVLVAFATWPQVAQMYSVSDFGDPLFSIWRLMWITHEFPRDPLNIFNTNQLYPEPRTLTFSDPVFAPALLFAPLYWLGVDRIVAYNVVFLTGGIFSGVSTFLLVRALTGRGDAAWISGAIFAVYPYRIEHLAHLELQMTQWVPIALWCLHRTLASGRMRDGVMFGLAFAAQFYSALYYGAFLMTYAFVVGVVLWLARGLPRRPLLALAGGGALAAVLFSPVASAYLKTRAVMGDRPESAVAFFSAKGPDYLQPYYRSQTYGAFSADAEPERALFPRITPLVLTLIAFWPPLSVARIAYLIALAFSIEVSLGMNGSIFPLLYEFVPPYGGIRVPARYSVMAGLTLAILSGYGLARVLRRWPSARVPIVAVTLLAVMIEARPRIELVSPWREPPASYATLIGAPTSVLAEFPLPEEHVFFFSEFAYVYFSSWHWHKLVNGQSGWLPPSYDELMTRARSSPSDEAVEYLRSRGVEYISVHGSFYPPGRVERILSEIDARSDLELLSSVNWQGRPSRLYRLRR